MNKTYKVNPLRPFYIFFKDQTCLNMFLSEYNSVNGFGIVKNNNGYKIYTNSYYFFARVKVSSNDGSVIGLSVNRGFPINQNATLEAVLKRVRVTGLSSMHIYRTGVRTNQIIFNGAYDFFEFIDNVFNDSDVHEAVPKEDEETYIDFLEEHKEIIEQEMEYSQQNLFSVEYSGFDSVTQNMQDGILYRFNIGKTEQKISKNTQVEISVNDLNKPIVAKVTEYDAPWLYLKFKNPNDSYTRIAAQGKISECTNVEYRLKLDAIRMLKNGSCVNEKFLDIVAGRKLLPIKSNFVYTPYTVQEKDGSSHDNVNPSQKRAIEKALSVDDFLLVQGPPGTGKTTIITEMVKLFVEKGAKILICSKNNLAVDNVLEKCQELYYDEQRTRKMQCLRLGDSGSVLPSVRCLLPRPLSLAIQDDVKKMSEQAENDYLQKETEIYENCSKALTECFVVCELIKFFLRIRDGYSFAHSALSKNFFSFLLGSKRKAKSISHFYEISRIANELCAELVNALKCENFVFGEKHLQNCVARTERIIALMQENSDELLNAKIRYKFILKTSFDSVLASASNSFKNREQLISDFYGAAQNYKGNPAWNILPETVNVSAGVPTDFADKYRVGLQNRINISQSKRVRFKNILNEWHEELLNDQKALEDPLIQCVKIIGATCIGANTTPSFKNAQYDVAIVDEAGQITLHDLLVPLVKAKKIILIGDHLQLPPSNANDFCRYLSDNNLLEFDNIDDDKRGEYYNYLNQIYSVSLFERLFLDESFKNNKIMLDTQFRMHPIIAEFISKNFYDGAYKSGVSAKSRHLEIAGFDKPLYFVDTAFASDKYEDKNQDETKHSNKFEAEICAEYISKIIVAIENDDYDMPKKCLKNKDGNYDIGIITAYSDQIEPIRKGISDKLSKYYESEQIEAILSRFTVNTLDSFQGRDNQIVFYSFVRSNKEKNIGFLNELRRINVMMTRAKSLLVMVGDSETLTNSKARAVHSGQRVGEFYHDLIEYCKDNNGYIDYSKRGGVAGNE